MLGVLESAGLRFDCLWVSGLTDEAWPLEARPNPFLPVALQKKAGIPQAAPRPRSRSTAASPRTGSAPPSEVIVSFPAKEKDRDLSPSPLIAAIAQGSLDGGPRVPDYPRYRDQLFKMKHLVSARRSRPARRSRRGR